MIIPKRFLKPSNIDMKCDIIAAVHTSSALRAVQFGSLDVQFTVWHVSEQVGKGNGSVNLFFGIGILVSFLMHVTDAPFPAFLQQESRVYCTY